MTTWSAKAVRAAGLLAILATYRPAAAADDFAELPKRATEFRLANGMRVVVLERHASPLVSFHLRAGAGVADEPQGKSGICFLLERMFSNGSESIGSRNLAQEKSLLQTVEKHMDTISAELNRGEKANPLLTQDADIQARIAITGAGTFGHRGVFREALEANGAMGARIVPGPASTDFAATFPAHRAEAWPRLMGEWLRKPSWRFFYEERSDLYNRVNEADPRPQNRMRRELLGAGFPGRPFSRLFPDPNELMKLRPKDLESFMAANWTPANLVLAIVGDISLAEARRMAETHFGKLPAAPAPPKPGPVQPLALETEKRAGVEMQAAPVLAMAWYRPDGKHPDDAAFDVLSALLESRRGPFAEKLAEQLLATRVTSALPSDREQNLFSIEAFLPPTQTFAAIEKQIDELLDSLASAPVSAAHLDSAKMALRYRLIGTGENHSDMAALLARFTAEQGSAAAAVTALDKISAVTAADVQRIARQYLRKQSRIVIQLGLPGMISEEVE